MKCCDLSAGQLRNYITIQREVRTPDGVGGVDLSWSDIYLNVPAKVTTKTGSEFLKAMRLEAKKSVTFYLRFIAGLRETDRILHRGRYFQIRSVVNIEERDRWLEVSCEEGVAQ